MILASGTTLLISLCIEMGYGIMGMRRLLYIEKTFFFKEWWRKKYIYILWWNLWEIEEAFVTSTTAYCVLKMVNIWLFCLYQQYVRASNKKAGILTALSWQVANASSDGDVSKWYSSTLVHTTTDPFHKPHNALDKYPTMYHFVTEMCTYVHISVTKWCIVGYGTGALWDLCSRSIIRLRLWLLAKKC